VFRVLIPYSVVFMRFDWDSHNEDHVLRHGIAPWEVEEALGDPRAIGDQARRVVGERRTGALGATDDGRILFVVFVWRQSRLRVVTAMDASDGQRRRYRRRGK
jgi:uncharacterized DUF497 family protein